VAVKSHKRLKLRHETRATDVPAIDLLDQFLETDVIPLGEDETFDVIKYWNDRYHTQPDLARMALDVLAVPCRMSASGYSAVLRYCFLTGGQGLGWISLKLASASGPGTAHLHGILSRTPTSGH
jgi:hypothetical protein